MKRWFLGFILSIMVTLLCVGCGTENTTTGQAEVAESSAVEENVAEQTTAQAEEPAKTAEPTEAPTVEPTETPTVTPTAEPTAEPKQVEEPAPEPSTEPVPEPQVVYTYTEMNATMYATHTVNVRNLPCTDGEIIGSLSTNQEITVLGQCNETSWYKFELDRQTAFVSNSYLNDTPIEVAQNDGGTVTPAPNTSSLPNFPYPLHTWTQQTSAEGCPILVIYSTYSSIGEIRYGTPSPTPDNFFKIILCYFSKFNHHNPSLISNNE